MKQYADVNIWGIPVTSASASGDKATVNFSTPQYANLQNIAGQTYMVPKSIWGSIGDPGKHVDATPVGTGPYTLDLFSSQGFTLKANPSYWGGAVPVGKVQFPAYASASSALSALQTNQLDWAGNFISGVQQAYVAANPNHKVWFPPIQTNSLEPNLEKFPTNQLAVRKAISLAIDRTQLSTQAEGGLEPPAGNASGLTLPLFQQYLHPSVANMTLNAHSDIAGAKKVLTDAGYTMGSDGMFRTKSGQKLSIDITNPSSFSDYAQSDAMIAGWLRKAGIDARFVGQSVTAWSSDLAKGNFQMTSHWAQSSVAPYQMYNAWLNSALATSNAAGNFERLREPQVDAALAKLGSDTDGRRPAARHRSDRAVRRDQPADHPDRLRRRVRRVQHEQVRRLAVRDQSVPVRQPEHADQRGRAPAPQAEVLTAPAYRDSSPLRPGPPRARPWGAGSTQRIPTRRRRMR